MDQAGEAAHDYTDAEKAQNDAAAEVAKNHVILLAGGGGGMGESAVQLAAAVLKVKVPLQTDIMQAVFLRIPMLFPMTPR